MTFVTDPMSLALALGLLGPAAVDEHGVFDDGRIDASAEKADLARALADRLDAQVDDNDEVVLTQTYTLDA
ncbi:MAG: hypothetical protein GY913_18520 [Proteobacteria bacterium]|nr:hypothetical protein [Pseudomonadota bacterium]MCP4918905.1 hypothetical protein [Pseudomonadota bacterium]